MRKSNISENLQSLSDDLLSLVALKPKSKQIVTKILFIKGFAKGDVRNVLKNLLNAGYVDISEKNAIRITDQGLKILDQGGFTYLDRLERKRELQEHYNEILSESDREKQLQFQESAIKVNNSNFNLHKTQRFALIFNIILAVINILLMIYNVKNG